MTEARFGIRVRNAAGEVATIYQCGTLILGRARGEAQTTKPRPLRYETADGKPLTEREPSPEGRRSWTDPATNEHFTERS
jgi:hypothetical protein